VTQLAHQLWEQQSRHTRPEGGGQESDRCLHPPLLSAGRCSLQEPGTGAHARGTARGAAPRAVRGLATLEKKAGPFSRSELVSLVSTGACAPRDSLKCCCVRDGAEQSQGTVPNTKDLESENERGATASSLLAVSKPAVETALAHCCCWSPRDRDIRDPRATLLHSHHYKP